MESGSITAGVRRWAGTLAQRHGGRLVVVALALILALGFGLRLSSALSEPRAGPRGDWIAYERIARSLYESGRFGDPGMKNATEWSPGAPMLFAVTYHLTGGPSPETALVAVAVLGTAMVLLVYLLGRRLGGSLGGPLDNDARGAAAVGLTGALGAAVYPPFIQYNDRLMSEPIAAFLVAAAALSSLWAADHQGAWRWLVPGALWGATSMTRPEYLPVGGAFALLALIVMWRRHHARAGIASALVLLAALGAVLTPWTVRNYLALGRLVPISTGGGKALFIGTYLPGNGDRVGTRGELIERFGGRETGMVHLLDRVASRYPGLDRDAALARAGRENLVDYATGAPGAYARMLAEKAARMWRPEDFPGAGRVGAAAPAPDWLIVHLALLACAVVGFRRLVVARRLEAVVLGLPIGAITAISALLLAPPRRHIPLLPLVIAAAAAGAVLLASTLWRWISDRRRGVA